MNIIKFITKTQLGLLPLKEDKRDLGFFHLFGRDKYKPKHDVFSLKPLSIKMQKYNTCGWFSSAGAKEIDEKVLLDARSLIMFGREKGYIRGDGYSYLRDNEKVLQKCGVAEVGLLRNDYNNWDDYSNPKYLTQTVRNNAYRHRTKTYLRIYTIEEVYKALDDGRPVRVGIAWRTSFNMRGGFRKPFILNFKKGFFVGGHAVYIYGYNQRYYGQKVFKVRNSFGRLYGDNGDFYIKEDDLQKQINIYGAFVNYDIELDIAKWLIQHQGKVVRTKDDPRVYLIQGNKKRLYPDMATLIAHGKGDEDVIIVDAEYLDKVEEGEPIDFWKGGNVKQIKIMIQKHGQYKQLFYKYFKELF